MTYDEFLDQVKESGGFRSRDEASAIAASVFRAIAEVLPQEHVEGLRGQFPPELMVYLRGAHVEPDPYFDEHLFLGWVVSTIDATGERDKTGGGLDLYADYSGAEAERRCQTVFKAIKSALDSEHGTSLSSFLPEGIGSLYASA